MMDPELNGARCDVCWPGKKNIASGTDNAGSSAATGSDSRVRQRPREQSERTPMFTGTGMKATDAPTAHHSERRHSPPYSL
jgi:hypothetical protein